MIWQSQAACRGKTDLFYDQFSERPQARERRIALARQLCAGCPVVAECGAYAEAGSEQVGIWAGRDRTPRGRRNRQRSAA